MYPVSEAYLEAMQQRTIATRWSGSLRTKDGVVYAITPSVIAEGGAKLTRQLCPGKDLVIGGTCSAQMDLKLELPNVSRYSLMNAKLTITHSLRLLDDSWEDVPLGEFEITEPPERTKDTLTIHAYDNMQKFNEDFGASVIGKPYDILARACSVCGVELGTGQDEILNMPNGSLETWNLADIQIYTWRDLIGYVASYLCCNAMIGPDGRLYLLPYRMTADRTITPGHRFEYTPKDYECYYMSIMHYFHISQEYESVILGPGGLDYDLGENPFIQFNDDDVRRAALTAIIQKLSELRYTPFSAKMPTDPSVLPGDVLEFVGNHAVEGKLAAVTKQVITMHGGMTVECCGDDPNLNVLTAQEKRIRTAGLNSNKDSMFYYDFVNAADLTLAERRRVRAIDFHYTTTKRTHVDFHAELKCIVDTSESYDEESDTYTEHDGIIEATYLNGGDVITSYYPVDLLTDGTQLLHLLYTWWASPNIISSFEVHLKCLGCSVRIQAGAARGYLAGPGLVGEVGNDGNVYIYDDFPPLDFGGARGRFSASAVPTLDTPESTALVERILRHNFLQTVNKPFADLLMTHDQRRYSVPYNDSEVSKSGILTTSGVWVNANPETDGTVTTPDTSVERIMQVRSIHTSGAGDVTYLVSFDAGATWYFWAGGWTLYESGYGMVEGTMSAIPASGWKEMLLTRGYVMIRAILQGDASLTDIQIYTSAATDWDSINHNTAAGYDERYVINRDDALVLIDQDDVPVPQPAVFPTIALRKELMCVTIEAGADTALWNVSFDGGATWYKRDGIWVLVTQDGDGCLKRDLEILDTGDWTPMLTNDTLRFRVWMSTGAWVSAVRADYTEGDE